MKKQTIKVGAILQIPLEADLVAYGQIVSKSEVAFFDCFLQAGDPVVPEQVTSKPILFVIPVMNEAVKSGHWRICGTAPLAPGLMTPRRYFVQDRITKRFEIYESESGRSSPASRLQVEGLENAAVWSAEHVEDRLRDAIAGRSNQWVEQLKPR